MLRLSSNATLFLKLFIPVFWTTVLVGLTAVTWLAPEHYFGGVPLQSLRYAMLLVLVAGVGTFLLALWPLKRVETDGAYLYVSNYFKTARYNLLDDVAVVRESRFLFLKLCTVELKAKGTFGKNLRFVASRKSFDDFRSEFAGVVHFAG
ncbi:hypothetical protein CLV84_2077 [Neolewinella xylanilytica]|uniref:PH (Pleckstrin Homology) domain-containing protein n=1 Tax=Neolewinella xylanilytica TaxID=1514080 RepID=A0A2S6I1Y3_9BACT|nr:hypothetical protein [Neolewinella xylanilytica]PPK85185.1 hypothetical protein CLV84_2077 [Neolewinella xylanilytica]